MVASCQDITHSSNSLIYPQTDINTHLAVSFLIVIYLTTIYIYNTRIAVHMLLSGSQVMISVIINSWLQFEAYIN